MSNFDISIYIFAIIHVYGQGNLKKDNFFVYESNYSVHVLPNFNMHPKNTIISLTLQVIARKHLEDIRQCQMFRKDKTNRNYLKSNLQI